MSFMKQWQDWMETHRDIGYDLVRIYLGLGLFAKGVHFIFDREFLMNLLGSTGQFDLAGGALAHYIALAHIAGGLAMALGLFSRLAAAVQIPILLGAVLFIHLQEGLFTRGQTLEFSLMVLFLLVLVFIYGAGRLSLEHALFRRRRVDRLG